VVVTRLRRKITYSKSGFYQSLEIVCGANSFDMNILVLLPGPVVDTVIMNPPFGTRKKGADLEFLSVAMKVSNNMDTCYIYNYITDENSNIPLFHISFH
jgi:hypothetical protein